MGILRVLVVDDDAPLRHSVARYLEHHGFEVGVAASFTAALAVSERFDVASLDLDLGDGNGVDLADELLRRGTVGRVLFLTGGVDADLQERAASLGPVLPKGDSNVLRRLVEALRGKEQARAIAVGGEDAATVSTVPPGSVRRVKE